LVNSHTDGYGWRTTWCGLLLAGLGIFLFKTKSIPPFLKGPLLSGLAVPGSCRPLISLVPLGACTPNKRQDFILKEPSLLVNSPHRQERQWISGVCGPILTGGRKRGKVGEGMVKLVCWLVVGWLGDIPFQNKVNSPFSKGTSDLRLPCLIHVVAVLGSLQRLDWTSRWDMSPNKRQAISF
jgi:hypothetical protein